MKTQMKSSQARRAFAPARPSVPSVIIAMTLVVGAAAASAADSYLSLLGQSGSPTLPADSVFYNVIHAYVPADIYAAYGVDALHNEGWTGKGQTIIVVDSYGSPTALQDLQVFSATFGLTAPDLTIIYPDGQPALPNDPNKQNWAQETTLDLQWAHAIAPDAKLVLIAANPAETEGVQGLPSMLRAIQYAVQQYPGSPISHSFATTEQTFKSAAPTLLQQFETVYQQADAAGCTPLAASGDWGSAGPVKQSFGAKSSDFYPYPTAQWPASSPSVTAVGGTWLQYHWRWNPQTNFAAFLALTNCGCHFVVNQNPVSLAFLNWEATEDRVEAVWREDWLDLVGPNHVSGGGLSAIFPTPSWQAGLPASLTQGARAVPDVSWNAGLDGGLMIYCTPQGGWEFGGSGTSAATPQIAGLVALVNQVRASMGKGPIGHLAPKLYQLPASDFNDIVPVTFGTGANAMTVGDNFELGSGVPGFPCTVGYDLTTGLGSPQAYSFVHDLAAMFP
jgi:subtilase family serine protease